MSIPPWSTTFIGNIFLQHRYLSQQIRKSFQKMIFLRFDLENKICWYFKYHIPYQRTRPTSKSVEEFFHSFFFLPILPRRIEREFFSRLCSILFLLLLFFSSTPTDKVILLFNLSRGEKPPRRIYRH